MTKNVVRIKHAVAEIGRHGQVNWSNGDIAYNADVEDGEVLGEYASWAEARAALANHKNRSWNEEHGRHLVVMAEEYWIEEATFFSNDGVTWDWDCGCDVEPAEEA